MLAPVSLNAAASPESTQALWPGAAPGERADRDEERDTTKPGDNLVAGRRVMRLGHVTRPTLTVYRPAKEKATDTAVLVFPGGGYHILAWDLEGTEVCEWLNSIGITAVLVKYRVPKREGLERHAAPLQDAQRALAIVRSRAAEWGIHPRRIGAFGASAGGHLVAALASPSASRSYAVVDDADKAATRPDFTLLLHPGYLVVQEEGDRLAVEVAVTKASPPAFIVMTQDDSVRVENALEYFKALKSVGVAAELHVYPTGGHGYGLRRTEHFVTTWPDRAADWISRLPPP